MFEEKNNLNKEQNLPKMGRVIDLKKILKNESQKSEDNFVFEEKNIKTNSDNKLFWIKDKKINFLHPYLIKEKEESFADQKILKEYLQETEGKEKNQKTFIFKIISFFSFLVFFKSIFKTKNIQNTLVNSKISGAKKREEKLKNPLFYIISALFAWPKSILAFLSGRTTEDYFYQKVLLEEITKNKFNPFKHLIFFAFIIAVFLLPIKVLSYYKVINFDDFKGRVLGVSEKAIGNLNTAASLASTLDFDKAIEGFGEAKNNFKEAGNELNNINSLLLEISKIIPNKKIRLASYGKDFLAIGESASILGENLTLAANAFLFDQNKNLSEMINDFLQYERLALIEARKININLEKININDLPEEYQKTFIELKIRGNDLEVLLTSLLNIAEKANVFLGEKSDKRYLFVFQNNSEMRASGGFIGSFALVNFSQGKIKNIETPGGGSYDTKGSLKEFVIAPEPLWLVSPLWYFWDANWWSDWKKSAQKLIWFYEKSGGPTVDGVIAFTPTSLESILKVIGPIDLTEKYQLTIDSENLWVNLRDIIEKEKIQDSSVSYELAEKKPKKIIGDLFAKIIDEMPKRLNKEMFSQLILSASDSLSQKQILFYFSDQELQEDVEKRNWAGRIMETGKDYLSVVNTNIAGGKSDGKMEEKINHQIEISDDGTIIDTVTIKKIHKGVVDEPYYGVRNVNWLRVYVPLGSELIFADGFRGPDPIYFEFPEKNWTQDEDVALEEGDNAVIDAKNLNTKIYQESGKTVFANWTMVDPGQEVTVYLKYKLPFKLEKKYTEPVIKNGLDNFLDKFIKTEKRDFYVYSLMVQKQPGMFYSSIKSSLKAPGFKNVWKYIDDSSNNNGWNINEDLNNDKYWAVIFEKNILENK